MLQENKPACCSPSPTTTEQPNCQGNSSVLLRIIFLDAKASFQSARPANMSLEQLFSTSELNVIVPDTTLEFPSETTADEWISRAKFSKIEKKQAFFGQ